MYNAILRKIVVFIVCIVCMSQMMLPKLKGMNDEDQFESIRGNYTTLISRRYSFDQPIISEVQLDQIYQSISLSDLSKNGKTGAPVLPIQCVNILLPYGCTDTDYIITTEVGKRIDIDIEDLLIEPGQRYYVDSYGRG